MLNAKPIVEFLKDAPKYLQLATKEIPAFVGQPANKYSSEIKYPAGIIQETELCIVRLEEHYAKHGVYIHYVNDKHQTTYVMVPNNFLASILPPEKLVEMEKKYAVAQERSVLRKELAYSGTVGSDPEIFVEDADGQVIPAFSFLGPKSNPYKAEVLSYWTPNNVYWDGFQAEFDTMPNSCFSGQCDSIHFGLQGVLKKALDFNSKAKLSIRTVVDIPPEVMAKAKQEHVQFGCMPSLNAYGMKGLDTPGHEVPFRPAGGHMHLSFYGLKPGEDLKIVKAMDAILGVACVSMFAQFDDPRRRLLYGLAGEYRLPAHGIEYRVLSNAWLIHPLLAHIVFDVGRTAAMVGRKDMLSRWECSEAETIRIINECDVEAARKVLAHNSEFLKRIIEVKYMNWWQAGDGINPVVAAEYTYNVIMNGLESVIADVHDVAGNWNLNKKNGQWLMHSDGPGKNVLFVFKHKLEGKKV